MAKYKLKLKGKEYYCKSGWVYKDNYNEKLDSAVIVIETKDNIDLKPFDIVQIYVANNLYFLVDNYVREIVQFTPYKKYKYTINLMSLVKYLERITLPSLSITKPINADRKSVYYYVNNIFKTYMPKYKVKNANEPTWHYEPIIKISDEFKTRFELVKCPDFSWNNPTLKEVLDDLCMVDDCICNVDYRFLTFLDLNNKSGNVIDTSHIYNEVESMSSSDFSTELDITMKNAIGENKVIAKEYASTRSEGGTLTTNNMAIYTQSPIYNLKSVKACFMLKYINGNTKETAYAYVEAEISPLIKEQEKFNILNGKEDIVAETFATAEKYKKYCLYYKRGDNKIQNLGSTIWFQDTLSRVIDIACFEDKQIYNLFRDRPSGGLDPQLALGDIRDISFIIEYETLADHKMKVGKYLPAKAFSNSVFDNQTGSYVDIKNQASFEYNKINRLGNKIHTIEGKYKSYYDIPNLTDTYNDEILFSREIMFYDDYIYFKGYLTKNYILKDYFTGVMSKRRSWAIAKNEEALTRYDISKFYVEFSYQEKVDKLEANFNYDSNESLMQILLSNFDSDGYQTIEGTVVNTKNFAGKYPENGYGYMIDFNIESQGMSLCLNFGFNDNYSVGNYTFKEDKEFRNGIYSYTNPYGNITDMHVEFCNYVSPADGAYEYPYHLQKFLDYESADPMRIKLANSARKKPLLVNPTTEKYRQIVLNVPDYYKDSREILKHTLQFEFCSDTEDIIINPEFVKEIYLARQEIGNYKIFVNTSSLNFNRYHIGDTKPIGVEDTEGKYGFAVNYDYEKRQFSASITLETYFTRPRGWNIYTWGIVDHNGKLMIGVNVRNRGTALNPDPNLTIRANLLKYRDDNVYDLLDNVIGKMWDYPKQ